MPSLAPRLWDKYFTNYITNINCPKSKVRHTHKKSLPPLNVAFWLRLLKNYFGV